MILYAAAIAAALQGQDGGPPAPPVQRNPEVGESRHDTSPPLRDLPPAQERPGKRVHPVLPLPRPKAAPDAGVPEKPR
jgi:hypothetical protein